MDTTKNRPPEAFRFLASSEGTPAIAKAGATRKFEGIAYSGDVIEGHWYWGRVVFDLSSTNAPQKLPMLLGHDPAKIVGFSEEVQIGSAIQVRGMLSNATKEGRHVAATSDEGFPWQMSVHIEPDRVDEVAAGDEVSVNGRHFAGPIHVFRNSAIREISFTPTGWDSNTSAIALAAAHGGETPALRQSAAVEFDRTEREAEALAARAQALMAEAAQRGQPLDVVDAVRLAQASADDPAFADARIAGLQAAARARGEHLDAADALRASKLPANHVETVARKARQLQHEAAQRGQYLDAADAIHRARSWG